MVRNYVNKLQFYNLEPIWAKTYNSLLLNKLYSRNVSFTVNCFNYNICFFSPARQLFMHFYNFLEQVYFTGSVGSLLSIGAFRQKYFKKTVKALKPFIIFLRYFLALDNVAIFYLKFKQFNFKQLLFLELFFFILAPIVHLINLTRSYNKRRGWKRRLKRKITKLVLQ